MNDYTSLYLPNLIFTTDDVAANRDGLLTPRQQDLLRRAYEQRTHDRRAMVRWFLIFFAAIIVVGAAVEYTQHPVPLEGFIATQGPIFVMVAVFLLALLGLSTGLTALFYRGLRDPRVSRAEGVAYVISQMARTRSTRYRRYEVQLRRGRRIVKRFTLGNESSLAHFQTGAAYRVYYVDIPYWPIILSAEPS